MTSISIDGANVSVNTGQTSIDINNDNVSIGSGQGNDQATEMMTKLEQFMSGKTPLEQLTHDPDAPVTTSVSGEEAENLGGAFGPLEIDPEGDLFYPTGSDIDPGYSINSPVDAPVTTVNGEEVDTQGSYSVTTVNGEEVDNPGVVPLGPLEIDPMPILLNTAEAAPDMDSGTFVNNSVDAPVTTLNGDEVENLGDYSVDQGQYGSGPGNYENNSVSAPVTNITSSDGSMPDIGDVNTEANQSQSIG